MRKRLGFIAGIGLAILGVSGMAGGGILWNFQGRVLGLGTSITALVLIGISLVLLRPLPQEPATSSPDEAASLSLQAPRASIIGVLLAVFGSFGLAASGILWNFKGLAFGLTGTITSLIALTLSFVFLRPLTINRNAAPETTTAARVPDVESSEPIANEDDPAEHGTTTTTAEQIARSLADSQLANEPVILSNFAPDHLLAGQSLPIKRRRASSSLKRYKDMTEELFRN